MRKKKSFKKFSELLLDLTTLNPRALAQKNVKFMKSWLGGESISSLLRGSKTKRKEELRLQVAQVHAALAVARLAAGIAGIVANCSLETSNSKNLSIHSEGGDWGEEMSTVVASAAALVATVCAEAAESVGANRAHVASAISTGLATRTFADMLAHTATAATCNNTLRLDK